MTSGTFQIQERTDRSVSGTVAAGENQILFLSIPYDKGWKVVVDGEVTKAEKIGNAFLAVPLTEGEHEITLTFTSDGFSEGWKISLISFGIFIFICAMMPGIRKRRRQKQEEKLSAILWDEEILLQKERKNEESMADERSDDL